jgi:hypothetical protein
MIQRSREVPGVNVRFGDGKVCIGVFTGRDVRGPLVGITLQELAKPHESGTKLDPQAVQTVGDRVGLYFGSEAGIDNLESAIKHARKSFRKATKPAKPVKRPVGRPRGTRRALHG